MAKGFNVTDLQPYDGLDRQVVHRDFLAHIHRWSFVLNRAKMGDTFVDVGCGTGNMLETLYRAKYRPGYYLGFDVRAKAMAAAQEKFSVCKFPVQFEAADLTSPEFDFQSYGRPHPTHVTSFEVVEHVGKHRVPQFLRNFMSCGDATSTYYLSTPNYDERVGAAGNHTYSAGEDLPVEVHEWDHDELNALIVDTGFEIVEEFGTFASQRDYKKTLTPGQLEVLEGLKKFYDSNYVSVIMAPLVDPKLARNAMRVLKRAS